jgi:hypothetical protein
LIKTLLMMRINIWPIWHKQITQIIQIIMSYNLKRQPDEYSFAQKIVIGIFNLIGRIDMQKLSVVGIFKYFQLIVIVLINILVRIILTLHILLETVVIKFITNRQKLYERIVHPLPYFGISLFDMYFTIRVIVLTILIYMNDLSISVVDQDKVSNIEKIVQTLCYYLPNRFLFVRTIMRGSVESLKQKDDD